MKCYRKNGSDVGAAINSPPGQSPSMKCYRKNGSDVGVAPVDARDHAAPSMKCYRKNGSDGSTPGPKTSPATLNEVLPKER